MFKVKVASGKGKEAHLDDSDQDKQIIIFKIHGVVLTNNTCNRFDNGISVKLRVATYRRADGVLW